MRRVNPTILAAAGIGLILVVVALLLLAQRGDSGQDRLDDSELASPRAPQPEKRCASQATYDRIKRELFRQAAQVRKSDQAAFDQIAAAASVRMDRPLLRANDEDLGTLRCSGRLSLDLPPGVAVVGGRRTLSADIDYVLQEAADGSGDVVMLEGADSIVIPLATLARTGTAAPAQELPVLNETGPGPIPEPGQPSLEPFTPDPDAQEPQPPRSASARPSFNCRYARSRGEIAVCNDGGLAALDRHMAAQYYRAIAQAGPRQRALLTTTRDAFLRYRDRCPSNACIAETYRGRMREIRDIMQGSWRPGG